VNGRFELCGENRVDHFMRMGGAGKNMPSERYLPKATSGVRQVVLDRFRFVKAPPVL